MASTRRPGCLTCIISRCHSNSVCDGHANSDNAAANVRLSIVTPGDNGTTAGWAAQLGILRRFLYLLWCPKGRFVYQTREGGGAGGTCVCGAATMYQLSRSLTRLIWQNSDYTSWIILLVQSLKCMQLLIFNFQVYRRITVVGFRIGFFWPLCACTKIIFTYLVIVSAGQRPAALRTRYTNRLTQWTMQVHETSHYPVVDPGQATGCTINPHRIPRERRTRRLVLHGFVGSAR